jgi:hypothetical protein
MNLKLTDRDKVLALFLPAILVVTGYAYRFGWPRYSDLSKAQANQRNAEAQVPATTVKLIQSRARLADLSREIQVAEAEQRRAHGAWLAATGLCPEHLRRNERIEQLTSVLQRCNLRLIEDGEVDLSRDLKITPTLEFLAKQMSETTGPRKPQLRRLRLAGRYLDLLAALDDLAGRSDVLAIPVSVALKEGVPGTAVREWTLLVWI